MASWDFEYIVTIYFWKTTIISKDAAHSDLMQIVQFPLRIKHCRVCWKYSLLWVFINLRIWPKPIKNATLISKFQIFNQCVLQKFYCSNRITYIILFSTAYKGNTPFVKYTLWWQIFLNQVYASKSQTKGGF